MKTFKLYDFWINIVLLTAWLVMSLVRLDYSFIYGYFVVGGWQVASILVHFFNGWFTEEGSGRRVYQKVVFWLFIAAAIGMLAWPVLFILLIILLFAAPFMALLYTRMCYREVYVKMQRPLAMLK